MSSPSQRPSPTPRRKKPSIGAHVSSAGGLHKAFARAEEIGAECLQIFTRAPSQWAARPFDAEVVGKFREARQQSKLRGGVFAHDLYLTNLAAADPVIRERYIQSQIQEIRRCDQLGIDGLVCHLGSHENEREGMRLLCEGIARVLRETDGAGVEMLLETTAGQGSCLGHRFEQLAECLERVGTTRLGICLDSCHVWAAGYDLSRPQDVLAEFDRIIGLQHLKLLHLNDSQKPLGSRVDRHDHIGKGCIGLDGFRGLLQTLSTPVVIETPENESMHKINLRTLRGLRDHKPRARSAEGSCER